MNIAKQITVIENKLVVPSGEREEGDLKCGAAELFDVFWLVDI